MNSPELENLMQILDQMPEQIDISDEDMAEESNQFKHLLDHYVAKVDLSKEKINKYCNEKLYGYSMMSKINRGFDRLMRWSVVYAQTDGAEYDLLTTGYRVHTNALNADGDKITRICEERNFAKEMGIEYLYVQLPGRIDCNNSQVPLGASEHLNSSIDNKLRILQEQRVDIFDLRSEMWNEGWSPDTGYYLTDGHWNTASGFMAAGLLASELNEKYNYQFDNQYFNIAQYNVTSYSLHNESIEETVDVILPKFPTTLHFYDAMRGLEYEGDFSSSCMDLSMAQTDFRLNVLNVYSVSRLRNSHLAKIENIQTTNNHNKTILFCANSMSWHLVPYIALDNANTYFTCDLSFEQIQFIINQIRPDIVITIW